MLPESQTGCLMIHGFGGNIDEVKPLSDYLTVEGYRVECPALKGHTGKREDLKSCTYLEWIASSVEAYEKLKSQCDTIFIIGFSMGGLIAFQIALDNKVDAIITMNTPIYYWDLKRITACIIDDIRCRKLNNIRRYLDAGKYFPLSSLLNFRRLLSRTKPKLGNIKCPIFMLQALEDEAVKKESANYLYDHILSKNKKLEFYPNSGHLILWSEAAENVIKDIAAFLKGI